MLSGKNTEDIKHGKYGAAGLTGKDQAMNSANMNCVNGHANPADANFCYVCGQSLRGQTNLPHLTPALSPGTRLRDRYVVRQELGQGGFGRTYLVEDMGRFNERLVIKEFFPSLQGTEALQKAAELFQQEARTLYQLQHPQIPKFWEIFQDRSRLFLVEDYVEGTTYQALLADRLHQGKRFSETETVKFLQDLLPVLSYLHQQGVIHRDIAPDNIIQSSKTGLPVLIDLGAAKQAAVNATTVNPNLHRGTSIGKVGYAPDEQVRLGIVAPYSDLYALAVTAIVLMAGKQPQDLLDQHSLQWRWQRELTLHPQFAQVLHRMLAPRPDQRFQSAAEVLHALNRSAAQPGFPVPSSAPPTVIDPASPATVQYSPSPALTPDTTARIPRNYAAPRPEASYAPAGVRADFSAPGSFTVNNSGQGGLFDRSVSVPEEIKGWNWGAFLLPTFWPFTNRVWIGLLAWLYLFWVPMGLVVAIGLGIKGNEWAWKSRQWQSIAAFKAHQRAWTLAGFIVLGMAIILAILGILIAVLSGFD